MKTIRITCVSVILTVIAMVTLTQCKNEPSPELAKLKTEHEQLEANLNAWADSTPVKR